MLRQLITWAGAALCWLAASAGAAPATSSDSIRTMSHRVWQVRDGAPADIWAMQQDPLGFIWLATGSGLYRFDGLRFKHYEPMPGDRFLATDLTALDIVGEDDLWVGASNGAISHVAKGRVVNYAPPGKLQASAVYRFARAPDGAMWAAAGGRLVRLADGNATDVGADWNYPADANATWVAVDRHGAVWVATDRELFVLKPRSHRFEATGVPSGPFAGMAFAPDGTAWLSDMVHGTRALPGLSADHVPDALKSAVTTTFGQGRRIAFDQQGNLWATPVVGNGIDGVFRVADASRLATGKPLAPDDVTDSFATTQGLTSMAAVPILIDREDNVWIGTNFGLDSFRSKRFHTVSPALDAASSMTYAAQGPGKQILLLQAGCVYDARQGKAIQLACGFPTDAYAVGAAGEMVYARAEGRFDQWHHGGAVASMPTPGSVFSPYATGSSTDQAGHLWVCMGDGLYRYADGAWQRVDAVGRIKATPPDAIAFDDEDVAWLGYQDGELVRWSGTQGQVFGKRDGLDVGGVQAISITDDEVWVSGDNGVARSSAGRWLSIPMSRLGLLGAVTGAKRVASGDLWLNTTRGIVRIAAADVEHAFTDPTYAPVTTLYGSDDGVAGVALMHPPASSVFEDQDGRLWFAGNRGVSWVDPGMLHPNTIAPDAIIESVRIEGKEERLASSLDAPALTRNISIGFTAASFVSPQNVRFRYRLGGVDAQWQDAGTSREATYANLKPGTYRFEVEAANSDGVWSTQAASLPIAIAPTFYQTIHFRLFMAMALGVSIVLLLVMQHRRIVARVRDRLEIRHAERTRIARDLHDTLLQGVQGLMLSFQAVAMRMPPDSPAHAQLDAALNRAEDVLVEGRNRVQAMRARDHAATDLMIAIATLGRDLAAEGTTTFNLVCNGRQRVLEAPVCEEVHFICREAMLNAFHHARATRVEVEITYDPHHLRLRVYDNGVGIDAETLELGGKAGHWGLVGMQERARSIDGKLAVWARDGAGTQVELLVPGRVAFASTTTSMPARAWRAIRRRFSRESEPR
ncbi:ATP-binding protein [Bacillus sp. NP157]|nr:ATP-binding protein [Bacillus sp. NP157]